MNRVLSLPLLFVLIALPRPALPDSLDVTGARAGNPKSVRRGLLLSTFATLVPSGFGAAMLATIGEDDILLPITGAGLITLGIMVGPLAGHVYAKQWTRACLGLGFRTAAVCAAGMFRMNSGDRADEAFSWFAFGAAGASVVFDIATVPASVRKYGKEQGTSLDADVDVGERRVSVGVGRRF